MAASSKQIEMPRYYVVHPLDDEPEQKRSADGLDRIRMSPSVKASLIALRGYLILIVALACYRLITLAVALGHHPR